LHRGGTRPPKKKNDRELRGGPVAAWSAPASKRGPLRKLWGKEGGKDYSPSSLPEGNGHSKKGRKDGNSPTPEWLAG